MKVEAEICKLILERPFPSTVSMTVEDDSALYFACRLFKACYVVTCFFREEFINCLFVKTELENTKNKTECDKNNRKPRNKEVTSKCNKAECDCEVNPA